MIPVLRIEADICLWFYFIYVDANYKMCGGRGRCSRKDLLTDLLHDQ